MAYNIMRDALAHTVERRRKDKWTKVISGMAAVVVFCTTYALILPAITMENAGQEPVCGIEEHVHTDECYELPKELTCEYMASTCPVIHKHDETCYDAQGQLICTLPEIEAHTHTDACYETVTPAEPHTHTADCWETTLICETPEHTHTDECKDADGSIICGQEEHTHGDACSEKKAVCGLEEATPEELAAFAEGPQTKLICGKDEYIPHTHADTCYDAEGHLICGRKEVLVHQHTADCLTDTTDPNAEPVLVCKKELHEHTDECFNTADVESPIDWEITLPQLADKKAWAENLLAVAESQLGYQESTENTRVAADGTIYGYTRYGQWADKPYGDWSLHFLDFCLHYAGIPADAFPVHEGQLRWCDQLQEENWNIYWTPGQYTPVPGDTVYLDLNLDGNLDAAAIVKEFTEAVEASEDQEAQKAVLTVIQGAVPGEASKSVAVMKYDAADAVILGYACLDTAMTRWELLNPETELPEIENDPEQTVKYYCGLDEHTHTEICYDEENNLICDIPEHTHSEECTVIPPSYRCGFEEHEHDERCRDNEGSLTCPLAEHKHTDACIVYYICGQVEHQHTDECYDDNGIEICGLAEHTHEAACMLTSQSVEADIQSPFNLLDLIGEKPSVTVSGYLPDGVKVTAIPLDVEDALFAYDITLYDADGNEFQPLIPVNVSFYVPGITDDPDQEVKMFHRDSAPVVETEETSETTETTAPVEDTREMTPVDSRKDEHGSVVVEAPHFSEYIGMPVFYAEDKAEWSCCDLDDYLLNFKPCNNNTPFGGAQDFNLFLLGDLDGWNAIHGNAAIGGDIKGVNGGIGFKAGSNFDYEANVTAERDIALLLGGNISTTAILQVANGSAIIKEEIVTREEGGNVQIDLDNTGNPKGHFHEIPDTRYDEFKIFFGKAGKGVEGDGFYTYAESLLEHNDHINRYAMDLQTGAIVDGHLGLKSLVDDLTDAEIEAYLGKQEDTKHSASLTDLVLHGENMFYNVFNIKSDHIETIGGQSRRLYLDVPDGSYVLVNIIGRDDEVVTDEIKDFGLQFWYRDSDNQWSKQPAKIKAMQAEGYDQSQMVLVNIAPEIKKMNYTTSDGNYFYASILAPRVDMTSHGCNLQGTIVFNSLDGDNQCNIVYSPFYVGASMTLSKETYCDTPNQDHSKVNVTTEKETCEIVDHGINGPDWEPYFADVKFRVSTAPGEVGYDAVKRELPMAGYRPDGKPFTIDGISPGYYTVADEVVYFKAHNNLAKDDPEYKERRLTVDEDGYYMVVMYLAPDYANPDNALKEDLNVNEWTLVYCDSVAFDATAPRDERWTCSIDEIAAKWVTYEANRTAEEKEALGLEKCEDEKLFYALRHHWNYAAFRAPNGEIIPTVTIQSGQNLEGYVLMNHYGLDPAKTVTVYKSWGEWKEVQQPTPAPAANTPSLLILDKTDPDGTNWHWFNVPPPIGARIGATLYWSTEEDGTYTAVTADDVPGIVNPITITEKTQWSGMWTDLPETKVVNGETKTLYYKVDETTEWPGYEFVGVENNVGDAWVLKNSPFPTAPGELTATKKWSNADGTPMTAEQIVDQPAVTVNLYQRGGTVPLPYNPKLPDSATNPASSADITKSVMITFGDPRPICNKEAHTHTVEECGSLDAPTCDKEEHTHTATCYNDTVVLGPYYFVTGANGSDLTVTLDVWVNGQVGGYPNELGTNKLKLIGTGADIESLTPVPADPIHSYQLPETNQYATKVTITAKLKNASSNVDLRLTGPATEANIDTSVTAPLITKPIGDSLHPEISVSIASPSVDRYDPTVIDWEDTITFYANAGVNNDGTLSNSNGWTYTWENLPMFEGDGDGDLENDRPLHRYGYYAIEEVPEDYTPWYLYSSTGAEHDGSFKDTWSGGQNKNPPTDANGNDVPAVSTGFITIRNTPNKTIPTGPELPMTGGIGTTPYTFGGLLACAAAFFLAQYKAKKRRKEDSPL